MSYSFVGAPAEFNGTDAITGGDSGMFIFPQHRAHVHRRYLALCAIFQSFEPHTNGTPQSPRISTNGTNLATRPTFS